MKSSLIFLAALAGTAFAQTAPLASGVDPKLIDGTTRPGDGFNAYANGAWTASAEIPADRSSIGVGLDVSLLAEARNAEIIKGASGANSSGDAHKIADYYAAYLDTYAINARGLAPLQAQLGEIAAIADRRALSAKLGATMRSDTDVFNNTNFHTENLFGLFVTQDVNRPTVTVPYLMQGVLGLPDRDYYLSATPQMVELRAAYLAYVAKQLGNAGFDDPQGRAVGIMALETKIANAHADIVSTQDAHTGDNPWVRADFARKAPGIDWSAYWSAAGLPGQRDFIAWQPAAIAKLSALVAAEPLATWKDWLAFHMISLEASVLPKAFDDASFDFFGRTLSGTQAPRPRDKRAITAVNGALGDAVGQIYARRYFPAS